MFIVAGQPSCLLACCCSQLRCQHWGMGDYYCCSRREANGGLLFLTQRQLACQAAKLATLQTCDGLLQLTSYMVRFSLRMTLLPQTICVCSSLFYPFELYYYQILFIWKMVAFRDASSSEVLCFSRNTDRALRRLHYIAFQRVYLNGFGVPCFDVGTIRVTSLKRRGC